MLRPEPVAAGRLVERDQQRGAVVALDDPRGDDPDHSRVPVLGPRARTRSAVLRLELGDLGLGLPQDPLLDRAALGVELVELAGDRPRPDADPSVSSSSRPASARRSRPAALIRGASRKPTVPASSAPGRPWRPPSAPAAPAWSVIASARRPSRTRRRFSPRSGTRSATVASATSSRSSSAVGAPSACASLYATPAPHRSGHG